MRLGIAQDADSAQVRPVQRGEVFALRATEAAGSGGNHGCSMVDSGEWANMEEDKDSTVLVSAPRRASNWTCLLGSLIRRSGRCHSATICPLTLHDCPSSAHSRRTLLTLPLRDGQRGLRQSMARRVVMVSSALDAIAFLFESMKDQSSRVTLLSDQGVTAGILRRRATVGKAY